MATLKPATAVTLAPEGLFAILDSEWNIWGPVGGYVAAVAMRGVGMVASQGHRPVTFTCQFLARGENGRLDIEVTQIKAGSTACYAVSLMQMGKTILTAQIWTTSKREGPLMGKVTMPDVPLPETLEPFTDQLIRYGHAPIPFWVNIDGRQVDFRPPGVPDPRGCRTERWLCFKDWEAEHDPFTDAARALIGVDTHIWAAHNRGLTALPAYVAPSLDLTVWFHGAVPEDEWQLVEARADIAGEGLLAGSARVWSRGRQLVASGGGQCLIVPLAAGK